jgi:hexosaminidase
VLSARGRRLVGWDEILESGLPAGAVVMSWRGAAGAVAAARHGDDVVMAPDPSVYLDHLQGDGREQPPGRVKLLSLADVYGFDPVPATLDANQARRVLGAQANLWSEYLTTTGRVEFAAFPRAAALAERLWSPAPRAEWNDFLARLPAQFERYRALGVHFSDSAFAPRVRVEQAGSRYRVTLSRQAAFGTIHYTLDGSEPRADSPAYAAALDLPAGTMLRAATFAAGRRLSADRSHRIDVTAARRRYSDALKPCSDSLLLRLEGAAGNGQPAPLYNVDLMNPCWIYRNVDFDATATIDVRVGALPYFFELWHDAAKVVTHAPGGDADELQLHLDTCDGPLLAAMPVAANGVQTLGVPVAGSASARHGAHDVCAYFAARSREPLRLIDWIEPLPRD